jgi:hypothetical protein
MIPMLLTVAIASILAYDVFAAIIDPDGDYLPSIGF